MKKIIEGKVYNTETADQIASYDNDCSSSDFGYVSEELYRTKKGHWFVAGEGGAMTSYARACGNNSYCGGERITPLTNAEAREWCEDNDVSADIIEEHFTVEEA